MTHETTGKREPSDEVKRLIVELRDHVYTVDPERAITIIDAALLRERLRGMEEARKIAAQVADVAGRNPVALHIEGLIRAAMEKEGKE